MKENAIIRADLDKAGYYGTPGEGAAEWAGKQEEARKFDEAEETRGRRHAGPLFPPQSGFAMYSPEQID